MKVHERTLPDRASHDLPLLLRVARADDHLVGLLGVARAGALGRLAPLGHRMAAARGAAFTTALRVVDRVLGDAAGQRALAHPAATAGLRQRLVGVVGVRHRTDRAHALAADIALLARAEPHVGEAAVAADAP